jgi:copper chaperone NosL
VMPARTAAARLRLIACALLLPVLTLACDVRPEPVHVGSEECAHCSMLISDRRFAAQLLSTKGKAYKFDSIECLRAFALAGTVAPGDTHSTWVTDSEVGDGWVRAEDAAFMQSAELRTPMGGGLAAYAHAAAAARDARELNGRVLSWNELLASAGNGDAADAQNAHADNGGYGAAH